MSVTLCVLGVTVMVAVVMVEGSEFLQPDWAVWSYLDEDCTLVCNHSDLPVRPLDFVRWELPSGDMVEKSDDKYMLGNDVNANVINMHLTISNVQSSDSGVYVCHVYSNRNQQDKRGHMVRGLNLGGHLYHDMFDKYRHNLLVGGCAAAALMGLFLAGCLIYKFRYRSAEQRLASRNRRLEATKHQRHLAELNGMGRELPTTVSNGDEGRINQSYDMEQGEGFTRM